MTSMSIHAQIKTDNGPAYVSRKMKPFFVYYNIKHIAGITHNSIGYREIKLYYKGHIKQTERCGKCPQK